MNVEAPKASSRHLLLVASQQDPISNIKTVVEAKGFETSLAENSSEAIDRITRSNFDLIILDIVMPEINAVDLLQFIHNK